MTDPSSGNAAPAGAWSDPRTLAIVVWGLYLGSFVVGFTGLVGFVVALLKRQDVAGTAYESHFTKAIRAFVIGLVGSIVGAILTPFMGIGLLILIPVAIWFVVVSVKGILRTSEWRPYDDGP